jgi:hypothetical protein
MVEETIITTSYKVWHRNALKEIDQSIAKEVMGWSTGSDPALGPTQYLVYDERGIIVGGPFGVGSSWHEAAPDYSTNIAEAWKIVLRLTDLGLIVDLHSTKGNVDCTISQEEEAPLAMGMARTAAWAISITALEVVRKFKEWPPAPTL